VLCSKATNKNLASAFWTRNLRSCGALASLTMNNLVKSVKATGGLGIIGVFVPKDPGAKDKLAKIGQVAFDLGTFWFKGQKMGTGQANVKAYNRKLRDLIATGKAKPSVIISHELPLGEAPKAYKNFDDRTNGWTKVVLKPSAARHATRKSANA
jgi:glutathione-independent formaldehyde dehydrogenase